MIYKYENSKFGLIPFVEWMADESNYKNWFNDREVTQYNSHGLFPYTKEKMKNFFNSINNETNVTMAIYRKREVGNIHGGDMHIGNVSIQSINWIHRTAELAIIIGDKESRGKGVGTQVCAVMLYHAFNKLGLNRVWSGTADDNFGMQKIFDKLGFAKEGIYKEGMWRDGNYKDIFAYAILSSSMKDLITINQLQQLGWKL